MIADFLNLMPNCC